MKVFLSYSHRDKPLAMRVADALGSAGADVWAADHHIFPGDNWAEEIGRGLEACDAMVVLVTPDSMESPWVRHDIQFALGQTQYQDRLVPVFVGGTADLAEIPPILRQLDGIVVENPDDIDALAVSITRRLAATAT